MKKIIMGIGLFVWLALPVAAENIGIVDMQRVFMGYTKTEEARKDFETKQNELKEELEKKREEVETAQKNNALHFFFNH